MSVSRFKFVSPGIFLKEIDKSRTPTESPAVGPTIIGRSVKGPMMRPVKINSYADFVELFGEPSAGGYNGDVWRAGVTLAPTYGAYAAKAYLAANGPVTFVRLGGYQDRFASTSGYAGWSVKDLSDTMPATTGSNGGAYGLFIAPIVSSSLNVYTMPETTGALAAIFYSNGGSLGMIGKPLSGSTETIVNTGSVWTRSLEHGKATFKIMLNDGTNTPEKVTFNFDPLSKDFIRNKFNTNPATVNSYTNSSPKFYFLGETFESFLNDTVVPSATVGSYAATLVALKGKDSVDNKTKSHNNFKKAAEPSETGWITSQHFNSYETFEANNSGEYPVYKLFKLVSLSEGEWNQNNIKISISDIKPSPSKFEAWGTFTLSIRKIDDNDLSVAPLEIYTGLNLNPESPNYIAKRIGNIYTEWNYERKMFEEKGQYPNVSKYIRVETHPSTDQIGYGTSILPFGFYGPKKFKSVVVSGSSDGHKILSDTDFIDSRFINSAQPIDVSLSGNAAYTASLEFPKLSLVQTSSIDSTATSLDNVYWGIRTKQKSNKLFDFQVVDLLRSKPSNVDKDTSGLLTYSSFFSLDDVMFSGSTSVSSEVTGNALNTAYWAAGNRKAGKSITSKATFTNVDDNINGYGGVNFQKIARFTVPLVGGFNGFDIREFEPFSEGTNTRPLGAVTDTATDETTSYAYNSIKVAIESVADPEVVETNIITVPGIQNIKLTNNLLEVCETRADALAIIDSVGDFKSSWESYSKASTEKSPSVTEAVSSMKTRNLNNSYGCTFFPAVLTRDTSANALVPMPTSVVALGVLGSSAANSEIWFAPAGFNRGGLSSGAAGFPVIAVKQKLTSKERDNLYEVNINPIASFPAEGIVVFGQKTLQATPSSLDRINVRRLMIYVKKEISRFASTVLFDPNVEVTWARFTGVVIPFLSSVKTRFGLTDFRVVLDETTTTPDLVDRNIVYAKIFLKPARAIEFIAIDFILTNTGASFDD